MSCRTVCQPVITIGLIAEEYNYIMTLWQILAVMNKNRTMKSTRMSHFHNIVCEFSVVLILYNRRKLVLWS